VGGLPLGMKLKLIEPLRDLFKDEVRRIGRDLQMPEEILDGSHFRARPRGAHSGRGDAGAGGAVAGGGRDCSGGDQAAGLYSSIWQSFAVLLPVMSVGVMGDQRLTRTPAPVRAVHSETA